MKIENQMTYLWWADFTFDDSFVSVPNRYILDIIYWNRECVTIGLINLN